MVLGPILRRCWLRCAGQKTQLKVANPHHNCGAAQLQLCTMWDYENPRNRGEGVG